MNKLLLLGRLTRDVEMRSTTSGTMLGKFGLAVNQYRGRDKKDEVLFIDCVAFDKTAELIAKHFKKGSPILLEGRLKFDQWEDKTTKASRSKHEMAVSSFEFLPRNEGKEDGRDAPEPSVAPSTGDIPF